MQTKRVLGVGLLLLIVTAVAVWQFGLGGGQPALPAPQPSAAAGAPAAPAGVPAPDDNPGTPAAPAAATGAGERIAVPADASLDARPAVVGRVVGADGKPVAGAKVIAAPGMSFANANGRFDFDGFEFADLDEVDDSDPAHMMNVVREQLAQAVEVSTDAEGHFRVHAKGTSRGVGLRVLARGHAILDRHVARPGERDVDVGTLSLQKGAIVAGRVLDPNGNAIAGARVSCVHEMEERLMGRNDVDLPEMAAVETMRGGETAATDAEGRFELLHLTAGEFALRARHPDRPTAKSAPLQGDAGRELRDVLVTMQPGGEIRGVVTGLPEGAKGLRVTASKAPRADAEPSGMMLGGGDLTDLLFEMGMPLGERTAEIAPDGKFVLRGLARQTYRVWVARTGSGLAGSSACSARVEAMAGATVELRFEPGVSVTFTVVDGSTGAPIERMWVRDQLRGGDGFADMFAAGVPQRGKQGHYPGGAVTVANLRQKPKQKLTLAIEAIGHGPLERADIELPQQGNLDLGTLRLEPAPVIQVQVVGFDDARPVAGATVQLSVGGSRQGDNPLTGLVGRGSGPRNGNSDRQGRCTLNRFVEGPGIVEVEVKGFAPFASEPLTFSSEGPDAFTARLHVGGSADVSVLEPGDLPVKDAVVEHRTPAGDRATRKSDAQGLAHFERLAPGKHAFRLGQDSGPMGSIMARLRDQGGDEAGWQSVEVADRATATLRLVQQPSALLRGVVRENGLPLAGARVVFRDGAGGGSEPDLAEQMMTEVMSASGGGSGPRSGKTDEHGVYALTGLPAGEHRLQITHKGRAMPALVAVVLRNGDNSFDVELDMTTVRGVVKDPLGNAVDGARIRVRKQRPKGESGNEAADEIGDAMEGMMPGMNLGGGSTIRTDAGGAFELRGVDPGVELLLQATAKGFAPASARLTAARGTTVDAPVLQLGAAGSIKLTVATDSPFAAVRARYVGKGDPVPPVIQILRKGKGTLDGLRPGPWEIEIHGVDPGVDAGQKRTVEVIAGQTIDVAM